MSKTFYQVDHHEGLEVDSALELNWPSKLTENIVTTSPRENQEVLQKLFPKGLSSHGARYAQAGLVCKDGVELNDG